MKVTIVGGGPSGLFLSILLKQRLPHARIDVHEQNPAGATFGFGVVLADTGLASLRAAAPEVIEDLMGAMRFNDRQTIVMRERPIVVRRPGAGGGAIPRIDLLRILQDHARRLDVDMRHEHRLADVRALDADLVVGADGVNSTLRAADEAAFGTTHGRLTNHFAWYGVDKAFETPALVFREWRGGCFVAHYYPYSAAMSTFVAECDDRTWVEFGMEAMDARARQTLFEEVFAPELGGHGLVSNHSSWRQFPVVRNRAWHAGNRVLLGDALASAHFSIGSGTRIAMEDAVALAEALRQRQEDVGGALESYVASRKPAKQRLIRASEASYNWYERVREWMRIESPHEFVYRFMTRTGRVDRDRLKLQYPDLVREMEEAGVAALAG